MRLGVLSLPGSSPFRVPQAKVKPRLLDTLPEPAASTLDSVFHRDSGDCSARTISANKDAEPDIAATNQAVQSRLGETSKTRCGDSSRPHLTL
jgi:hypothetical protein